MKKFNTQTGRRGEDLAVAYLVKKGYRILQRNFKSNFGEIDIIARNGNDLVFIEVKYRTQKSYGEPYEAVNARKLHKLRQMVDYYYMTQHPSYAPKIEVVSIVEVDGNVAIKHIHTIIF